MSADSRPHQLVLTVACPSAAGQVAAVIGFLDRHHCYIDELTVFDDDLSERFFVRCVFHGVERDETLADRRRSSASSNRSPCAFT